MSGDSAAKKHRNLRTPWQLGQSGNPAGRPKGTRNKLAQQFIDDVYEDWQEHGKTAVIAMREKSPERYCQMIAALIPQHFKVEHEHSIAGLSAEELRTKLLETRAKLIDAGVDAELLALPPPGNESGR